MPDPVDAIMGQVTRAVTAAHRQLERDVVSDVRRDLSTPYPPASSPGDSPHSRTGDLARGVAGQTTAAGDVVTTEVTSSRVGGNPLVPVYLNLGTRHMRPRPYMFIAVSRWAPVAPLRVAILTRANLSPASSAAGSAAAPASPEPAATS